MDLVIGVCPLTAGISSTQGIMGCVWCVFDHVCDVVALRNLLRHEFIEIMTSVVSVCFWRTILQLHSDANPGNKAALLKVSWNIQDHHRVYLHIKLNCKYYTFESRNNNLHIKATSQTPLKVISTNSTYYVDIICSHYMNNYYQHNVMHKDIDTEHTNLNHSDNHQTNSI